MDGVPAPQVVALAERLQRFSGLRLPAYRHPELLRAASLLAREHTGGDVDALLERLDGPGSHALLQRLAEAMTVGESYFFRDPVHFDLLRHELLPEILWRRREQRTLRMWSAACATGEEPYSLAILLHQLLPEADRWTWRLLGTDVDRQALAQAREGRYRPWSLRQTPPEVVRAYFDVQENIYRLREPVRGWVTFQHLNLAADRYPDPGRGLADFDLILCRNVLIYFDPETAHRVVQRLYDCLAEGGWLLVSAVEAMPGYYHRFQRIRLGGATVYRRPGPGEGPSPPAGIATPWERSTGGRAPWTGEQPTSPGGWPGVGAFGHAPPGRSWGQTGLGKVLPRGGSPPAEVPRSEPGPGRLEAAGCPEPVDDPHRACDRARDLASQCRWQEASHWLDRAEALAPDLARVHYWRGMVAQGMDDLPGALAALRRARYLDPEAPLVHMALATVWHGLGDPIQAARSLDNVERLLRGRPLHQVVAPQDEPELTVGVLRELVAMQRHPLRGWAGAPAGGPG